MFYESHRSLLERVLVHLEMEDRVDECIDMFLDRQKLKAKKDPNRPKKNVNAYTFFCNEHRVVLKKKGGGKKLDFGKMNKDLGKAWRAVKKVNREQYESMASEDAERYRAELEDYNTSLGLSK
jgi:hypothetical protein